MEDPLQRPATIDNGLKISIPSILLEKNRISTSSRSPVIISLTLALQVQVFLVARFVAGQE
jgi:hypothetical protein